MKRDDEHRDRLVELGDLEDRKQRLPEFGLQVPEGMVLVPAGEFIMGTSDEEASRVIAMDSRVERSRMNDEQPQRTVYLDDYAIDVHPVTVAEYRKFCKEKRRKMPDAPSWGWLDDHPIVNVSWDDAAAYCEWVGKRLPTEAEWEKAARGTDGRMFPWGNDWNKRAAHCDYQHKCEWSSKTAPVGSHPEGMSPYGCHDMIGNVSEWCSDWYDVDYYKRAPRKNPRGPDSGEGRLLRGGSWGYVLLNSLRCASRTEDIPDIWFDGWGFRCAQDLG